MKRNHLPILCALFISVSSGICQRSQPPEKPIIANYKPDILAEMSAHTKLSNSILADGDDDWNRDYGDPNANGVVYTLSEAPYNGSIYIGGNFDSIRGIRAKSFAVLERWGDSLQFQEIGGGVSGGNVYAIYVDDTNIYVGGSFTKAGDVPVKNIARWDGHNWFSLGLGTDSTVLALTKYKGLIYAGGNFTHAGDSTANFIASWSSTNNSWYPVIVDGINGLDGGVAALFGAEYAMAVGGGFIHGGKKNLNNITFLTDTSWVPLADGLSGPNSYVADIAWDGYRNDLSVCGTFASSGTKTLNNLGKFYDKTWQEYGKGLDKPAYSINAIRGLDWFIVCGEFQHADGVEVNHIVEYGGQHIAQWDGWGSGLNDAAYALVGKYRFVTVMDHSNPVFVGGRFTTAGAKPSHYFAVHFGPSNRSVPTKNQSSPSTLKLFPNPAMSMMTITSELPTAVIEITDALGRVVERSTLLGGEKQISVAHLPNGVYYCALHGGEQRIIQKFLVRR